MEFGDTYSIILYHHLESHYKVNWNRIRVDEKYQILRPYWIGFGMNELHYECTNEIELRPDE